MKIPNPGDEYPRFKNPRNSSKISKNSDRQKRKNPDFFANKIKLKIWDLGDNSRVLIPSQNPRVFSISEFFDIA